MRRLLLIVLAIVVLTVVGAAILIPLIVDKDKILEIASNTIHEKTGARLAVNGDTGVSFFPTIGLTVGDTAITLPDSKEPDFKISKLDIGVEFMPLLSGNVQINTFAVDGVDARVEMSEKEEALDTSKMTDSQLDAFYAKRRQDIAQAGQAAGAEAALAVPLALNVKNLSVTNANITLIDPAGAPPTQINLKRLKASGLNVDGREAPLSLVIEVPGDQPIRAEVNVKFAIDQNTQMATIKALEAVVTGATPEPLTLTGEGKVNLQRQVANLDINLAIDEIRGEGKLQYASFESPQIDSTLHFNLLDPAILLLTAPEAAADAAQSQSSASSGDEPLPLDALRGLDTKAALTVDQARFGAHAVNNFKAKVRALEGVINLTEATGEVHGGQLRAAAVFNAKHTVATLRTQGGVNSLDIPTALAATGSTAEVTGAANLGWVLSSQGSTSNELTGGMRGGIELDTREVALIGTNVEQLLCQAVALTNQKSLTATFPKRTDVKALDAKIQLADGKATLQPLTAELEHVGLRGSGSLELLSQEFDFTMKASLSKALEEVDEACSVSNKLTSIDWPVRCKGNLAGEPAKWCGVDSSRIIKDLATQEATKKVKKKASKFLKDFLNKDK
ncbi:MAG: AsmA family protein [Halioglobus sp.]